jgi:hypothetical protein
MSDEIDDDFEFPKLGEALQAAYSHRAEVPAAVDEAIRAAARERFDQRRRLRLMVRWGTGLAAGIAAAIVIVVSLHRPAPMQPLARGDHPLNMVDALNLARHVAARDAVERSWDLNSDGVIDRKDVDAVADAAVNLKQNHLAQHSLPRLRELGIDHPAGSALADVIPADAKTFAKANPTKNAKEEPQ